MKLSVSRWLYDAAGMAGSGGFTIFALKLGLIITADIS